MFFHDVRRVWLIIGVEFEMFKRVQARCECAVDVHVEHIQLGQKLFACRDFDKIVIRPPLRYLVDAAHSLAVTYT